MDLVNGFYPIWTGLPPPLLPPLRGGDCQPLATLEEGGGSGLEVGVVRHGGESRKAIENPL